MIKSDLIRAFELDKTNGYVITNRIISMEVPMDNGILGNYILKSGTKIVIPRGK